MVEVFLYKYMSHSGHRTLNLSYVQHLSLFLFPLANLMTSARQIKIQA